MGHRLIITIDGPAGVGKSTLGRRLARALGYRYVDSGALYRTVAWQALAAGLDLADRDALTSMLEAFRPDVTAGSEGFKVAVAGRDITLELRTPEVTQASSRVATSPPVRRWVGEVLRQLARDGGVVAEGRDLGSAVFPDAGSKILPGRRPHHPGRPTAAGVAGRGPRPGSQRHLERHGRAGPPGPEPDHSAPHHPGGGPQYRYDESQPG